MADHDAPLFDGQTIRSRDLKINGKAEIHPALYDALALGDEVVCIGTFRVSGIGHKESDKRGLLRIETLTAVEILVLDDDAVGGTDVLHKARVQRKKELDELMGTPGLDGLDDEA